MAHRESPVLTRKGKNANTRHTEESNFESFMMSSFNELKKDIKAIQKTQEDVVTRLDKIEQLNKLTDDKLKTLDGKITEISKACEFLASSVLAVETKVKALEDDSQIVTKKLEELQKKVLDYGDEMNKLERFSRRNNLRILGMAEERKEDTLEVVTNLLKEKFNFQEVELERAHRVGKPTPGRTRQIIFKLLRYTDKIAIHRSAKDALKGTNLRIVDDLTKADLDRKISLHPIMNQAYNDGKKVRFYDGRLYLDGQLYGGAIK